MQIIKKKSTTHHENMCDCFFGFAAKFKGSPFTFKEKQKVFINKSNWTQLMTFKSPGIKYYTFITWLFIKKERSSNLMSFSLFILLL